MSAAAMENGIVYTETVVHSAPEAYAHEAPYQIAIVTLDSGGRITCRIEGERVVIGDQVTFAGTRDGVHYYRRA